MTNDGCDNVTVWGVFMGTGVEEPTVEMLDAFNAHDLDAVMSFFVGKVARKDSYWKLVEG